MAATTAFGASHVSQVSRLAIRISRIKDEEFVMLVLSRKMGQELVIGDNIRITVSRIGGNRVTLGIMAPNDVRIVRGELEPIVRSFEIELEEEPAAEVTASRVPAVSGEPLAATWSPEPAPLVDLTRQLH